MEEKTNNLGSFQQATGRFPFNADLVNCFFQFRAKALRKWPKLFNFQSLKLLTKNSSLEFLHETNQIKNEKDGFSLWVNCFHNQTYLVVFNYIESAI